MAVTLVKRQGWNLSFNTIIEFNYRLHKQDNQYIFLQYYNGYGENLIDYNKFHSRIRAGFIIKPKWFSEY
jgi:phospholipase A1